jgi:uncharacterized protein (TIGR02147 family)
VGFWMVSVFDYLDFREFLYDWFLAKKEENPRFSHRLFSRKMAQKSPSFLKDIIDGRRNITTDQQDDFCRVLGLNKSQSTFFIDLVVLDQTKDTDERKRAFERLATARRVYGARRVEEDGYLYLSNWYCPAIRELALIPGFVADPNWIVEQLRPKISKKQAKQALEILQSLNMISIQEDNTVIVKDGTVTTDPQVTGIAVHNFHKQMLQLATESIDRFHSSQRHLVGVTVNVPSTLLPTLKKEINDFAARICDICDSSDEQSDKALQINLHFYPLSQSQEEQ